MDLYQLECFRAVAELEHISNAAQRLHTTQPALSKIISRVEDVDAVLAFAEEDQGRFSMGGMSAKLQAIREAVNAGTGVYMLHGRHPERIALLLEGKAEGIGTYFVPKG